MVVQIASNGIVYVFQLGGLYVRLIAICMMQGVFQLDARAVQGCFSTQRCFRKIEPCVITMVFMFTGTGQEGAWFCGLIVSFLFIYSRIHVLYLYAGWFM